MIFTLIFCSLSQNAVPLLAKDAPQKTKAKIYTQWNGTWELSAAANKLLGYSDEEDRADIAVDFPLSFNISIDEKLGTSISQKEIQLMQDAVFKKVDHKIVATGTWETTFKVDPEIEEKCFVTEGHGETFLWVPAPYVVIYGGEISVIQGATKDKDLLIIDFDATRKHLDGNHRSKTNVAYQRLKSVTKDN